MKTEMIIPKWGTAVETTHPKLHNFGKNESISFIVYPNFMQFSFKIEVFTH